MPRLVLWDGICCKYRNNRRLRGNSTAWEQLHGWHVSKRLCPALGQRSNCVLCNGPCQKCRVWRVTPLATSSRTPLSSSKMCQSRIPFWTWLQQLASQASILQGRTLLPLSQVSYPASDTFKRHSTETRSCPCTDLGSCQDGIRVCTDWVLLQSLIFQKGGSAPLAGLASKWASTMSTVWWWMLQTLVNFQTPASAPSRVQQAFSSSRNGKGV